MKFNKLFMLLAEGYVIDKDDNKVHAKTDMPSNYIVGISGYEGNHTLLGKSLRTGDSPNVEIRHNKAQNNRQVWTKRAIKRGEQLIINPKEQTYKADDNTKTVAMKKQPIVIRSRGKAKIRLAENIENYAKKIQELRQTDAKIHEFLSKVHEGNAQVHDDIKGLVGQYIEQLESGDREMAGKLRGIMIYITNWTKKNRKPDKTQFRKLRDEAFKR